MTKKGILCEFLFLGARLRSAPAGERAYKARLPGRDNARRPVKNEARLPVGDNARRVFSALTKRAYQ